MTFQFTRDFLFQFASRHDVKSACEQTPIFGVKTANIPPQASLTFCFDKYTLRCLEISGDSR